MKRTSMLVTFAVLISLTGCSDSNGGDGLAVNTTNISGAWELVSMTGPQGQTIPANLISKANENGYVDSKEVFQLNITASKVKVISSDEVSVTSQMESDYRIEGQKVITIDSQNFSMFDFEVVTVTATTLRISIPTEGSSPTIQWNLQRINAFALASEKLKPLPVKLNYELQLASQIIANRISTWFPTFSKKDTAAAVSCRYENSANPTFEISFFTFDRIGNGGISVGAEDMHLKLNGAANFNFKQKIETLDFKVLPNSEVEPGLSADFKDGEGLPSLHASLESDGVCSFKITRNKRSMIFNGTCNGVATSGDVSERNAVLKVSGNCILDF